jgi:hypothetical protein
MSRRSYRFTSEEHANVHVVAGWDRPLHYSFLVVTADDETLYSNLNDPEGVDVPPSKAQRLLEDLGLPIPKGFIRALERDRREHPGNLDAVYVPYTGAGQVQVEVWFARDFPAQIADTAPDLDRFEETHEVIHVEHVDAIENPLTCAEALFERFNHDPTCPRSMSVGDGVRLQTGTETITLIAKAVGWRESRTTAA